jgi:RNA polymerase sigma factor (sigma-70 family)
MSGEALFLANLDLIDRISVTLCRRHGVSGADADDFAALVRLRCVESEYAALMKFRGDSSLSTYLTVVISRWFLDDRIARVGKWRPSAAAVRAGPVGVLLDRYVSRAGCSIDEAVARVLAGDDHPYSERELRAIAATLPVRMPIRPYLVSDTDAAEVPDASSAAALLDTAEQDQSIRLATAALYEALADIPAEDRAIVSMRFLDGRTVAEVAHALGLEQKPLYRRIERSLTALRANLEARGVTRGSVGDMVSERGG